MFKYPFSPVAGSGLGVSYSSLTAIGKILPDHLFGQGKLETYVNVATGNLVIVDHIAKAVEMNGPMHFGFIYNSQAKTPWRIALKSLDKPNPANQTVTLIEKDGHETIYTLDKARQVYVAPGCGEGQPTLVYDKNKQAWNWFDPATGCREAYGAQGLLRRFSDDKGRTSTYEYDAQNLTAIQGLTGNRYEIRRAGKDVSFVMIENGNETTLQTHTFATDGRLLKTLIGNPGSYEINYTYFTNSSLINCIDQSDGTELGFDYTPKPDHKSWVTRVISGKKSGNICSINYDQPSKTTSIVDPVDKQKTSISFDGQNRVAQVIRENGDTSPVNPPDVTSYKYAVQGQLETVTHPNGSQEEYEYDTLGLRCHHKCPQDQEEHFKYNQDNGALNVHLKYLITEKPLPQYLINRYVYDNDFDKKHVGNRVLRFEISPTGRVTEYRYDKYGDVSEERVYIDTAYDVSKLGPMEVPTLEQMENWSTNQNQQKIQLSEYVHDSRGQLSKSEEYAHIDEHGQGIPDAAMGETGIIWAYYGNWVDKDIRQSEQVTTKFVRDYDDLYRPKNEINAQGNDVEQKTTYEHEDYNSVTITRPNGRIEKSIWDTTGQVIQMSQTAASNTLIQNRNTQHQRDALGRIIITEQPDGKKHYTFFDRQSRLIFEIDQLGVVIEHTYDNIHGYTSEIEYAIPISLNELQPFPKILPTVSDVRHLLKPDLMNDRRSYEFYDKSNRLHYEVDSYGYIIEHKSDSVNRPVGKIAYADILPQDQLDKLKQGKTISLKPDVTKDRFWQYFYDANSNKVGEQDPAGYVVEYKRDVAGQIIERIHYAIATKHLSTLDEVRPEPSQQDIHHYYYYDARGLCVAEVDGEKYMTEREFYASGKVAKQTRYANHVKADPSKTRDLSKLRPASDSEDHISTYEYDALSWETGENLSNKIKQITAHNKMNDKTLSGVVDQQDEKTSRKTLNRYDGWQQITAEAKPRVAKAIDDANTQEEKEEIWRDHSLRHLYDDSGLLLKTADSLGNVTYYYYDAARQLRFMINPKGAIKERDYNTFDEIKITRDYAKFVPEGTNLIGGFITPEVQKLFDGLKDDTKDAITQFEHNRRGLLFRKIDPEGYVTEQEHNAFRECTVERKPVADKQPSVTVEHIFNDMRGLETETKTSSVDLSATISRRYENPLSKLTSYIDEVGDEHQLGYDKLGRLARTTNPLNAVHTTEYDAFDRFETEVNSLQEITKHKYNHVERTYRIEGCDQQGQPLIHRNEQSNAFGEIEKFTDGLGNSRTIAYGPDGQVEKRTDELNQETKDKYNLCGWRIEHKDPSGIVTSFDHDKAGNVAKRVVDTQGLALKTTFVHNAFNKQETKTDPRKIQSKYEYERRNFNTHTIIDPSYYGHIGLDLATQSTYNGQGKKQEIIRGDNNKPNLRHAVLKIDSLNRNVGSIVDPKGLKINKTKHLDKASRVIAEIDPNGNISRHFYDKAGQKRFTLVPFGDKAKKLASVVEWSYNLEGKIVCQRNYATSIDSSSINDNTNLETIEKLVADKKSKDDKLQYKYYDHLGRIRFLATGLGIVTEKGYDQASREVSLRKYALPVDPNKLPDLTTEQLAALVNKDSKDRVTYYILNAAAQERYTIDSAGVVTEQKFDKNGLVINKVTYATPVKNPEEVAKQPVDQVDKYITKDEVNDRITYYVFDSIGRPTFIVDAEIAVTKNCYDENGNLTLTCQFADKIQIPNSYEQLVALLNKLQPDRNKDLIITKEYDNGNRAIAINDALQNTDRYQFNAVNQQTKHTDRASKDWQSVYDGASRLVQKITPPVVITTGDNKTIEVSIVQKIDCDRAGNQVKITSGFGSDDPRGVDISYDTVNQPTKLLITDTTLTQEAVYNAKGKKVVDKDEAEHYQFYVYDSENELCFEVLKNGAVIGYERNAFGEVITQTRYANTLQGIDLSKYTKTGLTVDLVKRYLSKSDEDRIENTGHDNQGNLSSVKKSPIFYYIPNMSDPKIGIAQPITRYQYNAFKDRIYTGVLIDSDSKANTWSERIKWVDRNGRTVAETDPDYYVKRYQLDAFGKPISKEEYATKLEERPTPKMTLEELDKKVKPDSKDRDYVYGYDQLGQSKSETLKNAIIQKLECDSKGIPDFHDLPPQDLTKSYLYSATQQKIATTYENDKTEYTYRDARGVKVAETKVPRASGDGKTLIPLTKYGVNVHGQQVTINRFRKGTASADPNKIPDPIDPNDPENQNTKLTYNKRGLMASKRDAEGHDVDYEYTPTGKQESKKYTVTNKDGVHHDEYRTEYDAIDNPTRQEYIRDGQVDTRYTQALFYNTFGENTGEGSGYATGWPAFQRYAKSGQVWLSNKEHEVPTITLHDLAGRETVRLQSAVEDLSLVEYDKLEEMLTTWGKDIDKLERSEKHLDAKGNMLISKAPAYKGQDPNDPEDMPLNLVVQTSNDGNEFKVTLSWEQIVETNLDIHQIIVWPVNAPENKTTLNVSDMNRRTIADVTDLHTDVYEYQADFSQTNPSIGDAQVRYRSKGIVQFDINKNQGSKSIVAVVQDDLSTLMLTGMTQELTSIELWQGEKKIDEISVKVDPKTGRAYVDLSKYLSGEYGIVPKYGSAPGKYPLKFTIFTAQPSPTPLGMEIECSAKLHITEDTHGELNWQVPKPYQQEEIQMECRYKDVDDQEQTHQDTLTPSKKTTEFEYKVKDVESLILRMKVGGIWIPILDEAPQQISPDELESDWVMLGDTRTVLDYEFPEMATLFVSPVKDLQFRTNYAFECWDRSMDRMAAWKELSISYMATDLGVMILNVTEVVTGSYPYRITNTDSGEVIVKDETFNLCRGCQVYESIPITPPGGKLIRPIRYYGYDVWNNRITYKDSLGNESKVTYNHASKPLSEITPPVTVVDEHGKSSVVSLITAHGYNERGVSIGVRDGNRNVIGVELNEAGQALVEILGDGTRDRSSVYDALARVISYQDARGKTWTLGYDRLNHEIMRKTPSGKAESYTYNEQGKRSSETNGANETTSYDHDVKGNISAEYQPDGTKTERRYDRNGQLLKESNKDGTSSYERDYFGNEFTSIDLGGAKYSNEYDYKMQVLRRSSTGGDHGTYKPFNPFKLKFSWDSVPTPGQDIRFTYRTGQVIKVEDKAKGQVTEKEYDQERRPIRITVKYQDGTVLQQLESSYDAIGRIYWTNDTNTIVEVGFDGANSRRSVKMTVNYTTINGKGSKTISKWFKYDGARRVIIDNGTLSNGEIVGNVISYQQDYRHQMVSGGTTNTYGYNDDGLLVRRDIKDGSPGHYTLRGYDNANRMTHYEEEKRFHIFWQWFWLKVKEMNYRYNKDGEMTYAYQDEKTDDDNWAETNFSNFTASGEATYQVTHYSGKGNVWDELWTRFAKFQELKMKEIGGYRHDDEGTSDYSSVNKYYGPNGGIEAISGASNASSNGYFITDENSMIIMKWNQWFGHPLPLVHYSIGRYFRDARNNLLGSYQSKFLWNRIINGPTDLHIYLDYFRPITQDYPPPTPGIYVVVEGDTFEIIAQKVYGDSSYAGLIAESNGWSVSDKPEKGCKLRIPQIIPSTNEYGAARPYEEFMAIMIGNLYPHLKTPQPHHHHSFFHEIVEAIAAVIVMILVPELIGMSFISYAIAGALANAVDQGLAIGFGDQSKFSWEAMFRAGIEYGVGKYVAGSRLGKELIGEFGKLGASIKEEVVVGKMLETAAVATGIQLSEMAVGLRSKFDIKWVLVQALTAGVDVKLSGAFRGSNIQNAVKSKYVDSLIRDIESNAISSAVYGTPLNMSNLAAGYIQNLAQDEGEQLKDALDKARQLDQAHYREAQAAARGDKYFGDSPSHKHVLASVSERVRTAAMERTLPKGEVNEEALLRDFLEPSDMERAIAAELAKVDQEILGGRNESRWTDYANFGKGIGKELGRSITSPRFFSQPKESSIWSNVKNYAERVSLNLQINASLGIGMSVREDINLKGINFFIGSAHGLGLATSASWDYSIGPNPKGWGSVMEIESGAGAAGTAAINITDKGLTFSGGIGVGEGLYFGSSVGYFSGRISWGEIVENIVKLEL